MNKTIVVLSMLNMIMGQALAAEGDTFTPYFTSGIVYDSNLLRLDDDFAPSVAGERGRSDTLRKNALGLDVDWRLSRQQFVVKAVMSDNDFQRFNTLDYKGKYLKTLWNYQIGNHISGNIGQTFNRALASFNDIRGIAGNLRDQQGRVFNLNWSFHPRWQTGFSYSGNDVEYDEPVQRIGDFESNTLGVKLDYLTPKGSRVGFNVSQEDGGYPNRSMTEASVLDVGYEEDTAAVVVDWQYSAKTSFRLYTGYKERTYDNVSQRDYDALDKRFTVNYSPTVKTQLELSVFDETYPRDDLQASVAESLGQSLELSWLPTAKLTFSANYERERRRDIDDPGFITGPINERSELNNNFSFSLNYAPHRNVDLTAGYKDVERDSNQPLGDYEADVFSFTATIRM